MRSYTITSLCGFFMTACAWFCLWVIAYYFVNDAELAILLVPVCTATRHHSTHSHPILANHLLGGMGINRGAGLIA